MPQYLVQMLLPDAVTWWTICECDSPDALAEVVRILFSARVKIPGQIQIRRVD
jgi:hypothetical protein